MPTSAEPELSPRPPRRRSLAERPREQALERFSEGWLIDGTSCSRAVRACAATSSPRSSSWSRTGTESSRIVGKEPYPDDPEELRPLTGRAAAPPTRPPPAARAPAGRVRAAAPPRPRRPRARSRPLAISARAPGRRTRPARRQQQRPQQVGGHGRRGRRRPSRAQVEAPGAHLDAVDARRSRASRRPTAASWSTPATGAKPSFAAAIASTPEPQPRSANGPAGVEVRAAAPGTAASSGARRCRTPARDRSRAR